VPEDAPGFFRSVRADEEEAHHHHIVIVDGLFDGVIRFQETGGQQFAGWLHHHRYAQFVQDIDIFMVEDKGIGGRRRVFQGDLKFGRPFPGKFAESSRLVCPPHSASSTASLTKAKELD